MATIFQKNLTSGENCLILEPSESLIYPFSIGDWNEIRVGVSFSLTEVTNDNSVITTESITSSSPQKSMFMGLLSGSALPFSQGGSFIGFGNPTGTFVRISNNTLGNSSYASLIINSNSRPGGGAAAPMMSGFSTVENKVLKLGYGVNAGQNIDDYLTLGNNFATTPAYMPISDSTGFCKIFSMGFRIVNKDSAGQYFNLKFHNDTINFQESDVSIDRLKISNSNMGTQTEVTGFYYNSDLTNTGSPVSIPSNLLLHFPFIQNRARIHSILLEKWA